MGNYSILLVIYPTFKVVVVSECLRGFFLNKETRQDLSQQVVGCLLCAWWSFYSPVVNNIWFVESVKQIIWFTCGVKCCINDCVRDCAHTVYIRFKVEPENTTVYQGHTAILHCQATGDPDPHIHWMVKDKTLDISRNKR